jgi:hypothetical protein
VQHVRRVSPQLGGGCRPNFPPELPPGGPPEVAVGDGIRRPQLVGDRLSNGVVDDQSIVARLNERDGTKALEGVVRRKVRQQRVEERGCHASDESRGDDNPSRHRVRNVGEKDAAQLVDHAVSGHVVDPKIWSLD